MSERLTRPLTKLARTGSLTRSTRSTPEVGQSKDVALAAEAREFKRVGATQHNNAKPPAEVTSHMRSFINNEQSASCTALQIQVVDLKNQLDEANNRLTEATTMSRENDRMKRLIKQQNLELEDADKLQTTTQLGLSHYKQQCDDLETSHDTLLTELETLRKNQEKDENQLLKELEGGFTTVTMKFDAQCKEQVKKITELKCENVQMQHEYKLVSELNFELNEQVNALMLENVELKETISLRATGVVETMTDGQLKAHKAMLDIESQNLSVQRANSLKNCKVIVAEVQQKSIDRMQTAPTAENQLVVVSPKLSQEHASTVPDVVVRERDNYTCRMDALVAYDKTHMFVMCVLFLCACLMSLWQPDNVYLAWLLFRIAFAYANNLMHHRVTNAEMTIYEFRVLCGVDVDMNHFVDFSNKYQTAQDKIFKSPCREWMHRLTLCVEFFFLLHHICSMTWVQELFDEMLTNVLDHTIEFWDLLWRSSDSKRDALDRWRRYKENFSLP